MLQMRQQLVLPGGIVFIMAVADEDNWRLAGMKALS